jgi:glutathione S-transferase
MLEELGVPYENVPVHFVGDTKKPEFLALNPNGRIPALEDDGLVLWESLAINLHLAEKYDNGFRPGSLEDRARTIQWSFWVMTEVEPGLIDAFLHRTMLPEGQRDTQVADAGEEKLQRPLAVLDRHLAQQPFILGQAFSLADLNVAGVLGIAPIAKVSLGKYPNVARWLGACMQRAAARKVFGALTG